MFADRRDAGRLLAELVADLDLTDPVVYALPRGGVPVALEVARRLHAPLDLILLRDIQRRRAVYLGDRARVTPAGRVVVIVDDGLATGATAKAALAAVKRQGAARIVLAVPVAPADAVEAMRGLVDEVVVVQTPEQFWAIGQFYVDFHQLSDDETVTLLKEAWAGP